MNRIEELKSKILDGGIITREEALDLAGMNEKESILELCDAANEIRTKFSGQTIDLCSIINAKSGNCSEDCSFCSQSAHYDTGIETYKYITADVAISKAKEAKKNGAKAFGLVVADRGLRGKNFDHIVDVMKQIKEEVDIDVDGSLGLLDDEQAARLKEIGVGMINHNLETSQEYFGKICTTHTWDERRETLRTLKRHGIPVCSGGIIGMGESWEDRIDLALTLREEEVTMIPMNFLDPRPGTPLGESGKVDPLEAIKAVAIFRFINPKASIKLAGGREWLEEMQKKALEGGANSLLIGGYLTTMGNKVPDDFAMIEGAGFKIDMPQEDYEAIKEAGRLGTAKKPTALVTISD